MVQRGVKGVRAAWEDAASRLARAKEVVDLPAGDARYGFHAGQWDGAPADRLPSDCPVIPLGVDGKNCFFVDTLGQLTAISSTEWSKKTLVHLFALRPNYLYHHWPRFNAKTLKINGLEVDDVTQCLVKGAAARGLFSPIDRVRGRGAWTASDGQLIWHAGDALYRVSGKRLTVSAPGEIDGIFYPHRPSVLAPWRESVDPSDTPAHQLFSDLRSWNWERPQLDPLLVLGTIGCMFLGAALPWRPHLFTIGDKGVGKSTLQFVFKGIFGSALIAAAETSAAGVYQRVKQDCLPVAIDELESSADNRKVMAVVNLARIAASGASMLRGGAEHEGVEFSLRNVFLFSAINPPPLEPQDKSRMAILNMSRLEAHGPRAAPSIDGDSCGRMLLRALMDAWPRFDETLHLWKSALHCAGLNDRAQATYGTLLAVAHLLLGDEALDEAGFDVTEEARLGALIGEATAQDRAEQQENWRACLEWLLGSTIEAWKGGEKPTIGGVVADWEDGILSATDTNARLALVSLRAREEPRADGTMLKLLCVPAGVTPALAHVFAGGKWAGGVWASALKQAPKDVVIRDRGNGQNVKINRATLRCLFIDLKACDALIKREEDGDE